MFPVKENRRALFDTLDALPWGQVPIACTATDKGHGRITTRTIQVLPAPEDLPFPHVSQVFLIERHVTDLHGQPVSAVAALGVASPAPDHASPADLAGYVREQWSIESLHWLRDTLYQEDKSKVRTRNGPRIMAALRNLAIGALRMAGRTDVTEATRWAGRSDGPPIHHPRTHIIDLGTAVRWPLAAGIPWSVARRHCRFRGSGGRSYRTAPAPATGEFAYRSACRAST